ncbi:MAG TPA: hypothetical protein VHV55_19765 [Pirellulales bacterium]|jgi:hypothetical protein|nr:hypothetical protein [Pirellulales bacterium]
MTKLARYPSKFKWFSCLCIALVWAWSGSIAARAGEPANSAAAQAPTGVRVYSIGHSFHNFMPAILAEIAKSADIADHQQLGASRIGGSLVIQHWDVADDKFKSKATISSGDVDVLTMSPIYLPDGGIENFVRLVSEKSPRTRVLVQEFWLPFDVNVNFKKEKVPPPNRDVFDMPKLEADHEKYFRDIDQHVRMLNEKYHGKPAVLVAPVGQAVLALREKIAAGAAPGLKKQTDLFTDAIGHPTAPLKVLVAYCYFAQVYGRSPVGLPVPPSLKIDADAATTAKLNRLLQELAWNAVVEHPLSGVKAK